MTAVQVIGVDCSTNPKNVGLAVAQWDDGLKGSVHTEQVMDLDAVHDWIVKRLKQRPSLLALDAPLGWPSDLGPSLAEHRAGEGLAPGADALFHRKTDEVVHKELNKKPLEVGANLIARTAKWSVDLLEALRTWAKTPIPLAWNPQDVRETQAIEVYPGATLLGFPDPGAYKGYKDAKSGRDQRKKLLEELARRAGVAVDIDQASRTDHAVDACLCVLTGAQFLNGECRGPLPDERTRAEKEGWIWFKPK